MEKDHRIEFAVKHWNKRMREINKEVEGLDFRHENYLRTALNEAIAKDLLTLLNDAGYGKE